MSSELSQNIQLKSSLTLSVIIPIYNGERFLAATISSVLFHDVVSELLLIDDGSTDQSFELCRAVSKTDSRIKVLQHPNGENRGAALSKNLGIINATNEFIAFLDQDDQFLPNKFKNYHLLHQEEKICNGLCEMVLMQNSLTKQEKIFGIKKKLAVDQLFSYLLRGGYFHTAGLIVRKELLLKAGLFDQRLWPHDDTFLWIKLAWYGNLNVIHDGEPVAVYLMHTSNNIYKATLKTNLYLWFRVFIYFFFKKISVFDRIWIVRRYLRFLINYRTIYLF